MQLKMYRLPSAPFRELTPPEGYSFSLYDPAKSESDKLEWVECCKNGLVGDDATTEQFDTIVVNEAYVNAETDVFFLDYEGMHIATTTAIYRSNDNSGDLHMVGMRKEFRGKGLSKYIVNVAIKKLLDQGVDYIVLTTDEWRSGAIKSYLNAGFLPVKYDIGMVTRWEYVLTSIAVDSCTMLNDDRSVFGELHRRNRKPDDKVIRLGVFGAGRGKCMMDYCQSSEKAKLVAVCESDPVALGRIKSEYGDNAPAFYTSFDEFIKHGDMDAVVLANYANEHAPYAIRCLESGKDVLSEVLPVQTMKEAVELCETIERTGRTYAYAENCCYMPAAREMRRMFKSGKLGDFEYGEGEYMHNCESGWHQYTRGLPQHWRNNMYSTFYCTHSTGPLIHMTGLRPVSVTAFEAPINARMRRMGAKAGQMGMEIITLENGALIKSIDSVGCSRNSLWWSVYGTKGSAESARELSSNGGTARLLYDIDTQDSASGEASSRASVNLKDSSVDSAKHLSHGEADYYTVDYFVDRLLGVAEAEIIEIYEALDMFFPGLLGYRSILSGGVPVAIPNFRDPAQRESYRNDTACTDPSVAGDMLIPSYSKGETSIPAESYDIMKSKYEASVEALK